MICAHNLYIETLGAGPSRVKKRVCHIWYLGSFCSMFKMLLPEMFMTWCNMGFFLTKQN